MPVSFFESRLCKHCGNRIYGAAQLKRCGDERRGWVCVSCRGKFREGLGVLGAELEVVNAKDQPPECAICHKPGDDAMALTHIDGRPGLVHFSCGEWYNKRATLLYKDTEFRLSAKLAGYK